MQISYLKIMPSVYKLNMTIDVKKKCQKNVNFDVHSDYMSKLRRINVKNTQVIFIFLQSGCSGNR